VVLIVRIYFGAQNRGLAVLLIKTLIPNVLLDLQEKGTGSTFSSTVALGAHEKVAGSALPSRACLSL
jgi:hypothetical protein